MNEQQKLITNEPIKNTPFRLIGNTTQGYAIGIGNYRLTEPKPTEEEAIAQLQIQQWNITANMIVAITETYRTLVKETKDNILAHPQSTGEPIGPYEQTR